MKKSGTPANRLILMRHAKSEWFSGVRDDFLRPLNERGVADAERMGRWLAEAGYVPGSVLSSPAVRTRETVALVGRGLGVALAQRTVWVEGLYHSTIDSICDALVGHGHDNDVMVVGHNPGLEELLDWLLPDSERDESFNKVFPTAGVYVLDCSVPLTALERGSARAVQHQRPKLLSE